MDEVDLTANAASNFNFPPISSDGSPTGRASTTNQSLVKFEKKELSIGN